MSEDRQKIWDDYIAEGGQNHKTVRHMFVDYSRYHEAQLIAQYFIDNNIKLNFPILDYGCGVGDYGIYLLRQGAADVDFYDYPRSSKLVDYRLETENLGNGTAINADTEAIDLDDYDFIIFGEVLEHLSNPYQILKQASTAQYIFTSSYPYRSDDINDPYWDNHDHDIKAFKQMPKCRMLLEDNYTYIKFDGELRLWVRK